MAMAVVASGPPSRWTIFNAVFASGSLSLGTDPYAADIEGMPIVPWPMPATNRLTTVQEGENWLWIIHKKGNMLNSANHAPPADTLRQPNLSVKNPTIGNEIIIPMPMEATIQPACDADSAQPVIRYRGIRNCLPYIKLLKKNWAAAAAEKIRLLKTRRSIKAALPFRIACQKNMLMKLAPTHKVQAPLRCAAC